LNRSVIQKRRISMKTTYSVKNMKCMGCVSTVRKTLEEIPGIESAEVDLETALASIEGDVDQSIILEALREAGYPGAPVEK
jgi:copper chaperone